MFDCLTLSETRLPSARVRPARLFTLNLGAEPGTGLIVYPAIALRLGEEYSGRFSGSPERQRPPELNDIIVGPSHRPAVGFCKKLRLPAYRSLRMEAPSGSKRCCKWSVLSDEPPWRRLCPRFLLIRTRRLASNNLSWNDCHLLYIQYFSNIKGHIVIG